MSDLGFEKTNGFSSELVMTLNTINFGRSKKNSKNETLINYEIINKEHIFHTKHYKNIFIITFPVEGWRQGVTALSPGSVPST